MNHLTVAIAGNPNSGKTTIFNALTGTHQHVGNYSGVTVEKKEGEYTHKGVEVNVVDLPGTYSLSAASLDERVARDFLIQERPDVVVDVIDATNFERHAYLVAQLVEIGVRLVLVLNMTDRARAAGQVLDLDILAERLGCEVVETVGSKGVGLHELKNAIGRAAQKPASQIDLDYGDELGGLIDDMEARLRAAGAGKLAPYEDRWAAIRLLEEDEEIKHLVRKRFPAQSMRILSFSAQLRRRMEGHHGDALAVFIAERQYGFAAGLYREILRQEANTRRWLSDRIDDLLTHRMLGIPIFLGFMYLVFWMTFTLGQAPMEWLDSGFGWLASFLSTHWPDGPLKSLVIDGVIGGVGGVVIFLPNIVLLFLGIALLEDTGYMARVAFIMDRLMHRIGLHGKSFIPMLVGFGCSVPAIMATRTLENRRDRLATMMVIPLMSCGARLPIYALFIPAFFPEVWRARVLWLIYLTGVLLAVLVVRLLRSTLLRGESTPFVMELPPYRMPTLKGIVLHMWQRSWMYLRKAGTVILLISIIMWVFTSFPKPKTYTMDEWVEGGGRAMPQAIARAHAAEDLRYSIAGRVGHAMEVVTKPLGFDWRINTALLGAFAAKEVFVSQLSIIFSIGDADTDRGSLIRRLQRRYTPLTGLCVILFCLIATPCMATVAVTWRESGSIRWALLQFFGLTALAYLVVLLVNQVGRLIL